MCATVPETIKVLVCGGRKYTNVARIWAALDALQSKLENPIILIEGEARGADSIARDWAKINLPEDHLMKFPADWDRWPKAAGPIRNRQMLKEGKPDVVLAFGGLEGTGTNDMVDIAKKAGIPVVEFDRDEI